MAQKGHCQRCFVASCEELLVVVLVEDVEEVVVVVTVVVVAFVSPMGSQAAQGLNFHWGLQNAFGSTIPTKK
jgi:hypothetical protein